MSDVAIRVEGLGKQYRIGARQEKYKTLRDTVTTGALLSFRAMKSLTRRNGHKMTSNPKSEIRNPKSEETIWALTDVSFEVTRGEVVGIIGRNGAGKSTLLKILCRITEPTEGCAEIHGRVGSLLEVGTGFHPELTGRENIYLNGSILGMKRAEIDRRFDEIVTFAEVEKFIDTPVKHYSSGMYLRLAFAVAAHLEPENLLVDEVLAVGDAGFQKKCLGKMGDVAKQGRTVLFVSHNMSAVKTLCRRCIWLDGGRVVRIGEVGRVVDEYLRKAATSVLERVWDNPSDAPGDDRVRLHRVSITSLNQGPREPITVRTAIKLSAAFWNYIPGALLNFSIVLYNLEGIAIFNTGSGGHAFSAGLVSGSFVIPSDFLNDATYTVRLLIVKDRSVALLDLHDVLLFEVQDSERIGSWYGKVIGAVRPKFDWVLSAGARAASGT